MNTADDECQKQCILVIKCNVSNMFCTLGVGPIQDLNVQERARRESINVSEEIGTFGVSQTIDCTESRKCMLSQIFSATDSLYKWHICVYISCQSLQQHTLDKTDINESLCVNRTSLPLFLTYIQNIINIV